MKIEYVIETKKGDTWEPFTQFERLDVAWADFKMYQAEHKENFRLIRKITQITEQIIDPVN